MSALSPSDRKLLLGALHAGQTFERSMSETDHSHFVESLRACATAESDLVRRLSELAAKSSRELGQKHLMALLVPIERLAGRSARDEEFLFQERDGLSNAPAAAGADTRSALAGLGVGIVLCENIRSAFNVGAIYRTIETFGGREVWLGGYTPEPLKTAMGTDIFVHARRFDRSAEAVAEARSHGYSVVALENSPGAVALDLFQWPEKTLLVLGNERFGVDSETLAACDHVVRIPTLGQKNSLNVGIAFGIAAAAWSMRSQSLSGGSPSKPAGMGTETLSPIGTLVGGFANPQVAPRQGSYAKTETNRATIELESRFQGRPSNFSQALQDLDGFERAWIVFGFHESQGWNPQVRPPRGDGTKRGLFATRSPQRPNRIGISCVKIENVDAPKMRVTISEHDLLEGTPIYDIKPYVPEADAFADAKAGWVADLDKFSYRVSESPRATGQLDWLQAQGETRLRNFFDEQLRFQPLDTERKRVEITGTGDERLGAHHTIAFRTWRIDFRITDPRQIEILAIRGGYTHEELTSTDDPYKDKQIHRDFLKLQTRGFA